jgi:hypothetical protein
MQEQTTEVGAQHVVHQRLEGRGGIGEPERHDQELEVTMVHPKCHLGDVLNTWW